MTEYSSATQGINFLQCKVIDVILYKFNKTERMSIMPQYVDLNFYMSLFMPIIKADLLINDTISLHTNFPLIGEETIEVTLQHTRDDPSDPRAVLGTEDRGQNGNRQFTLKFHVSDTRQAFPDDKARSSFYNLSLYSIENWYSSRNNVMRAYNDQYSNIVQDILKKDCNTETSKINSAQFETSKGTIKVVVPNMSPIPAIMWMAKRAVPMDNTNFNYVFYEDLFGFHFVTLQSLYKSAKTRPVFAYYSDVTEAARSQFKMTNNELVSLDQRTVTAISLKKRFSTTEKINTGFYENEYFEIDLFNLNVRSTVTEAQTTPKFAISNNQINTNTFLQAAKTNVNSPGQRTRVKYVINHSGGDAPNQDNFWKDKFGEAVRGLSSLAEIQLSIAVPGDTRITVGQMVTLELPQFHGFNKVEEDKYISGDYIIVSMKHNISVGTRHMMVLDLARDSFTNNIDLQSKYNLNAGNNS